MQLIDSFHLFTVLTTFVPGSETGVSCVREREAREKPVSLALPVTSVLYLKVGQGVLAESVLLSCWQMECWQLLPNTLTEL